MTQAERRLEQAENARARLWDRVNGHSTQLALVAAELKAINTKLDDAKKAREEAIDQSGDRRFQIGMVLLAAIAGPILLGAIALLTGAHP